MTYFKNVRTLKELRKQYKELLKTYHPDNGGNVSDMQDINAEYGKPLFSDASIKVISSPL